MITHIQHKTFIVIRNEESSGQIETIVCEPDNLKPIFREVTPAPKEEKTFGGEPVEDLVKEMKAIEDFKDSQKEVDAS